MLCLILSNKTIKNMPHTKSHDSKSKASKESNDSKTTKGKASSEKEMKASSKKK